MAYNECEKCCFDLDNIIGHSDFPDCHNVKKLYDAKFYIHEVGTTYESTWEITCPICGTKTTFSDGSL